MTRIKDVKLGSLLRADSGFTCMPSGALRTVKEAKNGERYIDCDQGRHFLDGQEEGDEYVGLELVVQ